MLVLGETPTLVEEVKNGFLRLGVSVVPFVGSPDTAVRSSLHVRPDVILVDSRACDSRGGMDIAADIQKHVGVPVVYFTSASDRSFTELANQGDARLRWATLSPRERAVFALVVRGKLNKQIASDLHITERTVKAHRARVMRKMKVDSVAELVKTAVRLGLAPAKNPWHES